MKIDTTNIDAEADLAKTHLARFAKQIEVLPEVLEKLKIAQHSLDELTATWAALPRVGRLCLPEQVRICMQISSDGYLNLSETIRHIDLLIEAAK